MVIKFKLTTYRQDEFVGEVYLNVTAEEVRRQFGLEDEEYPGDCLLVTESKLPWLETTLDLENFDHFVECYAP